LSPTRAPQAEQRVTVASLAAGASALMVAPQRQVIVGPLDWLTSYCAWHCGQATSFTAAGSGYGERPIDLGWIGTGPPDLDAARRLGGFRRTTQVL
jgi:hypothetical protein